MAKKKIDKKEPGSFSKLNDFLNAVAPAPASTDGQAETPAA
jgi:hypothetical protein